MLRLSFIIYTKPWSKIAFPIIKNVFPSISAKDLVSVQPMNLPAGQVFYMDFVDGNLIIVIFEELWWEEDENGNLYCPQIENDDLIPDSQWQKSWDEWLIIPKWEIEQQEKHVGGLGNEQVKPFGNYPIDNLPPPKITGKFQKASGKSGGRTYPVMKRYARRFPKNMNYGQ